MTWWLSQGRKCLTSVPTGQTSTTFKECGLPATKSVVVGVRVCHYCNTHAEAAQRFVNKQGQEQIKSLQRLTGGR